MKFRKQIQEPVKPKKARAFVVTRSGGVFPYNILEKAEITKADQQLPDEEKWIGSDNLAKHPYPASSFYFMWESNVMVWACVDQIATDVAGLGWTVKPREDMAENQAEYDKIMAFIKRPNPDMSFRRINKAFIMDWGVTGNSALQVVRRMDNEVSEVRHMPTGDLWVHKGGKKFCQRKDVNKAWFARFAMGDDPEAEERKGLPLILDPKTGEESPGLNIKQRANELIFYHTYYPKSRWYGVPNMLPTTGDILTGLGIRDYNLSFFTNCGIPACLVTLTGEWEDGTGEDDTDSITIVKDYMNSLTGADKAHSTLVVDTPEGCEIKVDKLAVEIREGSFRILRTLIDQDILVAYKMPPYRLGLPIRQGSLAGNVAAELTTNYINGVVEPLQRDIEELWSDNIFAIGLNCPSYEVSFTNLDIRDEVIEHEEDMGRIRTGTMTPNQYREKRGETPYATGYSYYMDATLVEIGEDDSETG